MGYLGPGRERLKLTRSRIKSLPLSGENAPHIPTDEDKKLLEALTAEIRKRQVSSSENFDKSVLTLSSGGLAVSLGFLKDFLPIDRSLWPWALYASWIALTAATVVTMLSFLASARALDYQQEAGQAYYLQRDESRIHSNPWDRMVIWMNRVSGASFISGAILTTLFVAINLQRAQDMKNQRPGIGQDGLTSPAIQKISNVTDLRRGLTSPAIVPSAPARPASTPAPQSVPASHSTPSKK
ncbi:MAG: hypothetical protein AB9M53_02915 [Leptothrix sp. (in: b-proteobacteria)]